MENQWLKMNQRKLDSMQYQLTEFSYKNENPQVPFIEYRGVLAAAIVEIKKLQTQINELTEQLKKK